MAEARHGRSFAWLNSSLRQEYTRLLHIHPQVQKSRLGFIPMDFFARRRNYILIPLKLLGRGRPFYRLLREKEGVLSSIEYSRPVGWIDTRESRISGFRKFSANSLSVLGYPLSVGQRLLAPHSAMHCLTNLADWSRTTPIHLVPVRGSWIVAEPKSPREMVGGE